MSRTTATEKTFDPGLTGRYGAIGIVAVSAALMFTGTAADEKVSAETGRPSALPVFAPIADYLIR
jgi:hypothetical protein